MKRIIELSLAGVLALSLPLVAAAQSDAQEKQKTRGAMEGMQGMEGMHGMMKSCRAHGQQRSESLAKVLTSLREAKESNDPARMRAAIEQAEKPLGAMQQHMSMCMKMMNMMHEGGMGGMHGGEGMMDHGMMGHGMMDGRNDAAATAVDPVCGMKVDPETAASATWQGKTYYFCSADEKAKFEADPEKYVGSDV